MHLKLLKETDAHVGTVLGNSSAKWFDNARVDVEKIITRHPRLSGHTSGDNHNIWSLQSFPELIFPLISNHLQFQCTNIFLNCTIIYIKACIFRIPHIDYHGEGSVPQIWCWCGWHRRRHQGFRRYHRVKDLKQGGWASSAKIGADQSRRRLRGQPPSAQGLPRRHSHSVRGERSHELQPSVRIGASKGSPFSHWTFRENRQESASEKREEVRVLRSVIALL